MNSFFFQLSSFVVVDLCAAFNFHSFSRSSLCFFSAKSIEIYFYGKDEKELERLDALPLFFYACSIKNQHNYGSE